LNYRKKELLEMIPEGCPEQSKHLMADVPRNFTLVAKKRNERIPKLKALLDQAK
jgi:hypothetical protein